MRTLTIIVVILAAIYGGYWFVGSRAVERGATAFLDNLSARGWEVSYDDLSTAGFPSRFDTTVENLRLVDPATGIGWETPVFQALALSYAPNSIIAVWPETQTLTLPGERIAIDAEGLRASARVAVNLALPLDTVTVESGPATATSDRGWQVALADLLFAFRRAASGDADYDIFLESTGIAPSAEIFAASPQAMMLPPAFDRVRLDAAVTLAEPLDIRMEGPVTLRNITLREAVLDWGDVSLVATGTLAVAPDGTPTGDVRLAVQNWQPLFQVAVDLGFVPTSIAPIAQRAAAALAENGAELAAPISLRDGKMFLGPLPLGPAPRFPVAG